MKISRTPCHCTLYRHGMVAAFALALCRLGIRASRLLVAKASGSHVLIVPSLGCCVLLYRNTRRVYRRSSYGRKWGSWHPSTPTVRCRHRTSDAESAVKKVSRPIQNLTPYRVHSQSMILSIFLPALQLNFYCKSSYICFSCNIRRILTGYFSLFHELSHFGNAPHRTPYECRIFKGVESCRSVYNEQGKKKEKNIGRCMKEKALTNGCT